MIKYLLDSNIVSKLCHPKVETHKKMIEWFFLLCGDKSLRLYLPEIVDYEVRRGLTEKALRDSSCKSLERLERFSQRIDYLPLTTQMWRAAAKLWAEQRINGTPTAPSYSLDGDVLLAAQANSIGGVIVTENIRHLDRMAKVQNWNTFI